MAGKIAKEFEGVAAKFLIENGYEDVDVTRYVGDYGVDVFCKKDGVKIAVQVKMYGTCRTKISRKSVMELYGAAAYFDCQKAMFVYTGRMTDGAVKVANKLDIECIDISEFVRSINNGVSEVSCNDCNEDLYTEIKKLEGRILQHTDPEYQAKYPLNYKIREVTNAYVKVINLKSLKETTLKMDCFVWTAKRVCSQGLLVAVEIRDEFNIHHSSCVSLIFEHIPGYKVQNPGRIISKSL